ncbi:MAG: hypothetical protein ACE5FQ_09825 [Thiogranum sp.]
MSRKTKGRAGGHQATPKTSQYTRYFTGLASQIKAVIVTLSLWGWLPMKLADWVTRKGGQHHE